MAFNSVGEASFNISCGYFELGVAAMKGFGFQ